jgi:hypothetical protein
LKRESKVLEIVRREAIGAGGSLHPIFGLFSGAADGRACGVGERSRAPVPCSSPGASHAFSPWERASIGFMLAVADGYRIEGPVGRPHGRVLPARSGTPAIAGAEGSLLSNSRPQGRGTASSRRAHVRGSGTDARAWCLSSVARVHLRWVSDAGGTALIDPS